MSLVVDGVQVLRGVICRFPIEIQVELLTGLPDLLLDFLCAQVLLLDQLELFLPLPLLLTYKGPLRYA